MKKIAFSFYALILLLALLCWLADPTAPLNTSGVFPWRSLMTQYLGVLSFGLMSVAMILATRPVWLESALGGLDKTYRLHKWLGLTGIGLGLAHWLAIKAPKWLVQAGWLVRPPKGPAKEQTEAIFQFFQSQKDLAEALGEWGFYALLIIGAVALIKFLSYKNFFKCHRLVSIAYLAVAIHSVILLRFNFWASPLGWAIGLLTLGGTISAGLALAGKISWGRRYTGRIEEVNQRAEVGTVEVVISMDKNWPGHKSGQFAFVTFHAKEGAHPYTIASSWPNDGRLSFLIKGLGDYTKSLATNLRPGDQALVEGPYGRFNFESGSSRQIWVGGGIGITPFIARLQELAQNGGGQNIDFYYTTATVDKIALDQITVRAQAAGLRLHVMVDAVDGFLTPQRLMAEIPDWQTADIWFCGPPAFGQALCKTLVAHGYQARHFHQELFKMR